MDFLSGWVSLDEVDNVLPREPVEEESRRHLSSFVGQIIINTEKNVGYRGYRLQHCAKHEGIGFNVDICRLS